MNMSEIQRRPHTVCSMPKMCVQSEYVLKLIEEIENEAKGPILKPKSVPKDHMKENLKRLRDIQYRAKQKLAEKQSLQPLKAMSKFNNLPAKTFSTEQNNTQTHLRIVPKTAQGTRVAPKSSVGHRALHQSLPELNQEEPKKNYETSQYNNHKKSHEDISEKNPVQVHSKKSEMKHRLGKIPNYLTERKRQWEAERERLLKRSQEPPVPEGYTLLPDEERVETLDLLKKNQDELVQSLAALPVRNDTVRIKNRKEELEKQLAKVEEGIKIFSRPKVLIKNDM